jgi:dTDP-4-amino-4,6-dideoxygalactose transaminase
MIVLNKAYLTGKESVFIGEALKSQTSGNGAFTKKCHQFFSSRYGFKKTLLTTSCTDALEMAALLLDIKPNDEVIMPSFTFVSTANAFILRGAKIVFADSSPDHPNIDVGSIEKLINSRTRVIVVVHYAGVSVDMDAVMAIAEKFKLFVVEDAAQAIDAYYKGRPLGSIGHMGCFSFHDTKNIVCGEGGMLALNDKQFIPRAEILWEKGTNRSAFIRGEVDKYGWVDVGSSFLPSEITAAFLYAQLEALDEIQSKRTAIWEVYKNRLAPLSEELGFRVPHLPDYAQHNAHIFYLMCNSKERRDYLLAHLKEKKIQAFFHYPPLHLSRFHLQTNAPTALPNAMRYYEQLIRIPVYAGLTPEEQQYVIETIIELLKNYRST